MVKRIASLLILLITAFLPLSCASYLGPSTNEKGRFAFVIDCGRVDGKGICILGNFESGIKTVLLEKKQPIFCLAETQRGKYYEGFGKSFSFTGTSPITQCGEADLYSVAILGVETGSYGVIRLEQIYDTERLKSLDKIVRSTTALETLRTQAQDLVPGVISQLSDVLPKAHRYPIPKMDVVIVSYDDSGDENHISGPRVILVNGVAYPLTGWCSYGYMRAFHFNGEYYLESGSCCCNCGGTIQQLFKIGLTGLIEVHSDATLSD